MYFKITHRFYHKFSKMVEHFIVSGCDVEDVANPNSSNQHIRKILLLEPKKALAAGPLRVALVLILTSP